MRLLRQASVLLASVILAPVLCVSLFLAQAQLKMTVDQLVSFIKSSIQLRHDDRKVADYVKKIRLANALDARTVEDLQGMGAGPQTVMALKALAIWPISSCACTRTRMPKLLVDSIWVMAVCICCTGCTMLRVTR